MAFLEIPRFLLLLAASASLALHLDPAAADPLWPKNFSFSAAAGLVLGLALAKPFWGGRLELPPRRILAAMAGLLAALLLSLALSPYKPSIGGWLLFFALFLGAYDFYAAPLGRRWLQLALAASLLVAVLNGFQRGPTLGGRFGGGFGNPNFLAGFLVLAWPAALLGASRWSLLPALAALALLALTGSKAALLGLAWQYFAFGHLGWHSDLPLERRRRFLARWALAGAAALGLGLLALPAEFKSRLADGFSFNHESVRFRLHAWQGALAAWKSRPLTGHGPGSFAAAYPSFRVPASMGEQEQHSYEVTHPENWPLQLLSEAGLLGLAAALVFAWLIGWPLWKRAHAWSAGGLEAAWLVLGLGGALVTNLAALDLFLASSAWPFALMAALALRQSPQAPLSFRLNAGRPAAALATLLLLGAALLPAALSLSAWSASRELHKAKLLSQASRWAEAAAAYQSSLSLDPSNPEAHYFLGATYLDAGHPAGALAAFAALQLLAPDYVLVHDKKAHALRSLGRMGEAAAEWERQLELDPYYLPAVQQLSSLYASLGRRSDAIRVLEQAVPRFPGNKEIVRNLLYLKGAVR